MKLLHTTPWMKHKYDEWWTDRWEFICDKKLRQYMDMPKVNESSEIRIVATTEKHKDHIRISNLHIRSQDLVCSFDGWEEELFLDFYEWIKMLPIQYKYLYLELRDGS